MERMIMPGPGDRIKPNGKHEINCALPKGEGGNVLALRELHNQSSTVEFLRDNIKELAKDHNLGSIGYESYPFLMVFEWAYRDGKLGTKEQARATLQMVYKAETPKEFEKTGAVKCELALAAYDAGVKVVHYDGRERSLMEEYYKRFTPDREKLEKKFPDGNIPFDALRTDEQQAAWLSREVKKLCDANPEYKARMDGIETFMKQMRAQKIPADTVTSIMFTQMADQSKNAVTIIGGDHQAGYRFEDGGRFNVQGIFDEGLAKSGWKVTDAIIASEFDIHGLARYSAMRSQKEANNFDLIDLVYAFDKDIVAYPGIKTEEKKKNPPLGLPYDVFSAISSPPVDTVFTPQELDPSRIPELKAAIEKLHGTFHPDGSAASSSPKAAPAPKGAGRY